MLIIALALASTTVIFLKSNLSKKSANSAKTTELSNQQLFKGTEVDRLSWLLIKFRDNMMFRYAESVYKHGFWEYQNDTIKRSGITLDPNYENQVLNGLKNYLIILHQSYPVDYGRTLQGNLGKPVIAFTKKSTLIFESLIINANQKLKSGTSFKDLPTEEKASFLMANPSPDTNVLTDSKYTEAFENIKSYINSQNKVLISEFKSICDTSNQDQVRHQCYTWAFSPSYNYLGDLDCNLIEPGSFGGLNTRSLCYLEKAVLNQDRSLCKFVEESGKRICDDEIYAKKKGT